MMTSSPGGRPACGASLCLSLRLAPVSFRAMRRRAICPDVTSYRGDEASSTGGPTRVLVWVGHSCPTKLTGTDPPEICRYPGFCRTGLSDPHKACSSLLTQSSAGVAPAGNLLQALCAGLLDEAYEMTRLFELVDVRPNLGLPRLVMSRGLTAGSASGMESSGDIGRRSVRLQLNENAAH